MSSIHTVRKSTDYSTSTMPLITPVAVTTVLGTSNVKSLIGSARGFDRVLHTPHATVVLDSLPALLRCGYRISMDNESLVFTKHGKDTIVYVPDEEGYYYRLLEPLTICSSDVRVYDGDIDDESINDLLTHPFRAPVSIHQLAKYERIQSIHEIMGHIPYSMLLSIITKGLYEGVEAFDITADDIRSFITYNGKCLGCLAGKLSNPSHDGTLRVQDLEYSSQKHESLRGDVMVVRGKHYLILIHHSSKWAHNYPLKGDNYTGNDLYDHIAATVKTIHRMLDIPIRYLRYDGCPKLGRTLEQYASLLGVTVLTSVPGCHEPVSERYIRTLKDTMRSMAETLPYSIEHGLFDNQLVDTAMFMLNRRPRKSTWKSPYEMIYNKKPHATQVGTYTFGEIVIIKSNLDHINTMKPRTIYAIYLGLNRYNSMYNVVALETKAPMTVPIIYSSKPMTTSLLSYLNDYENQGRGFKYKSSNVFTPPDDAEILSTHIMSIIVEPTIDIEESAFPGTLGYECISFDDIEFATMGRDQLMSLTQRHNEHISSVEFNTPSTAPTHKHVDAECKLDTSSTLDEHCMASSIHSTSHTDDTHMNVPENSADNLSVEDQQAIFAILLATSMSYKQCAKIDKDKANAAYRKELDQLINQYVFEPVVGEMNKMLPRVPANTIYTIKSNGLTKARLILYGNLIHTYITTKEDISAGTAAQCNVTTVLTEIASQDMYTSQVDVTGAFLNAILPPKDQVYAIISHDEVDLLLEVAAARGLDWSKSKRNKKGDMYLLVVKALYGHPAAPKYWYDDINAALMSIGFTPLTYDKCVFKRIVDGKTSYILLHVDDLFIGSTCRDVIDMLEDMLRKRYPQGITIQRDQQSYTYLNLNITFNKQDRSITIRQFDYFAKTLDKYDYLLPKDKASACPHIGTLVHEDDTIGSTNPGLTHKLFLAIIMTIYWGAKRSRTDILFTVSYLATRCTKANDLDWANLIRLLVYIRSTLNEGQTTKFIGDRRVIMFVDSSMHLYPDTRGHGGHIICVGTGGYSGIIEAVSGRAKSNARSSTEYELLQLDRSIVSVIYVWLFLQDLGIGNDQPIIVLEDNLSVIAILKRGLTNSGLTTKHFKAKLYNTADLIKQNMLVLLHCPTQHMLADILTKPLVGTLYTNLKATLMNNNQPLTQLYNSIFTNSFNKTADYTILHSIQEDENKTIQIIKSIDATVNTKEPPI